tara:strand:- start:34893 stop:35672 length:780 start_codon:yes stop_codon:yes gene_type:complete
MTQVIGFAGKKQSGKNTICNYIIAMKLAELQISEKTKLGEDGKIYVSDILGERKADCEWIEFSNKNMNVKKIFKDMLGDYIRIYGLADALKDMCVDILGLTNDQVYGTDDDKNTKTHIRWEDTPTFTPQSLNIQRGTMTAREVLQYIGTDVFRKLDDKIWIKALLRKIHKDNPEVALICDVRFKNEIKALQQDGGIIIGLKRNMNRGNDSHSSEKEIESCLEICDRVIDNQGASIKEQCEEAFEIIHSINSNILPTVQK